MSSRLRVLVGLGNPGPRYARTRHNVGSLLLDRLARDLGAVPETRGRECGVARAARGGDRIVLVRPRLYMNRSGEALAALPESAEAGPGGHLILLDDVWLPFGALRLREQGGAGGHRGLASVLEHFGTEAVPRLRLGIGGEDREELAEYVLEGFSEVEERELEPWLARASEGVLVYLDEGPASAMNRLNG